MYQVSDSKDCVTLLVSDESKTREHLQRMEQNRRHLVVWNIFKQ